MPLSAPPLDAEAFPHAIGIRTIKPLATDNREFANGKNVEVVDNADAEVGGQAGKQRCGGSALRVGGVMTRWRRWVDFTGSGGGGRGDRFVEPPPL